MGIKIHSFLGHLMPNYRVQYAFERPDSETLPDDDRYGFGVIVVNTDKAIETQEELKEIARFIAKNTTDERPNPYPSVGIVKITETDLTIESDGASVLTQADEAQNIVINAPVEDEDEDLTDGEWNLKTVASSLEFDRESVETLVNLMTKDEDD
jgi:hypothetical protein